MNFAYKILEVLLILIYINIYIYIYIISNYNYQKPENVYGSLRLLNIKRVRGGGGDWFLLTFLHLFDIY